MRLPHGTIGGKGGNEVDDWDSFKSALMRRLEPAMAYSPYSVLFILKQDGSMQEYRTRFEACAGQLKVHERKYCKTIFLNGLKEEVRAELILHPIEMLSQMMDKAELIDSGNKVFFKGVSGGSMVGGDMGPMRSFGTFPSGRVGGANKGSLGSSNVIPGASSATSHSDHKPVGGSNIGSARRGFRALSDKEYREKRAKGLCFTCDEKFTPEHVCKNKHYRYMVIEEDEVITEEGNEVSHEPKGEPKGNDMELDVVTFAGLSTSKSLRLWGWIQGTRVWVLIDTGASHSFISQQLVEDMGLLVTATTTFG